MIYIAISTVSEYQDQMPKASEPYEAADGLGNEEALEWRWSDYDSALSLDKAIVLKAELSRAIDQAILIQARKQREHIRADEHANDEL